MKRPFGIKLKVLWTTMDRQGPGYEPLERDEVLHCGRPILLSEIEAIVRAKYGPFLQEIQFVGYTDNTGGLRSPLGGDKQNRFVLPPDSENQSEGK